MKDLIYDGVSLNQMGLAIKNKQPYKVAERDLTFETVTARNGDVIVDNLRYKNIEMNYQVNSIPHRVSADNTSQLVREFIEAFAPRNSEYKILRDDYNPGYFTHAICTNIGEINHTIKNHIDATLTFNRKPFWYSDIGAKTAESSDSKIILDNPEKFNAEPYIRLYAYGGEITVCVNGVDYIINLTGITSGEAPYIELDTELQSAFYGEVNRNQRVNFNYFPVLIPGENVIEIKLTGTKTVYKGIEIIPRWRRL